MEDVNGFTQKILKLSIEHGICYLARQFYSGSDAQVIYMYLHLIFYINNGIGWAACAKLLNYPLRPL